MLISIKITFFNQLLLKFETGQSIQYDHLHYKLTRSIETLHINLKKILHINMKNPLLMEIEI
jgi:MarR-like DNA-binding transcriptional regulator SgrR of sgrS sRNA